MAFFFFPHAVIATKKKSEVKMNSTDDNKPSAATTEFANASEFRRANERAEAQQAAPAASGKQLVHFLCQRFGLSHPNALVHLDPLGRDEYIKGYELARTKMLTLKVSFQGSAMRFQALKNKGVPIRMTVDDLLDGNLQYLYPDEERALDRKQGVTPRDFDVDAVLVNSMGIMEPDNSIPFAVGIYTNGIPDAYNELKQKQVAELGEKLGIKLPANHIYAQIPTNCGGPKNDEAQFAQMLRDRSIPLLNEVINGYHGEEVTRCVGSLCANHMWKGVIPLTPQDCIRWQIDPPPGRHDAWNHPDTPEEDQQVNVWVLVPSNHVLGHITQLDIASMRRYGYVAYQMYLPNGNTAIPFILMDLWTARNYAKAFMDSALFKIHADRVCAKDLFIELRPLKDDDWISGCKAGQHHVVGTVSFKLTLKYTMFTRNFRQNSRIVAAISERFPRLNMHRKQAMDASTAEDVSMQERLEKAAAASAARYKDKGEDGGIIMMDQGADGVMMEDDDEEAEQEEELKRNAFHVSTQQQWHAAF